MKIAIFTDIFLPKVDGVVTSLEQLILELERIGHQILVIAPKTKNAPTKVGNSIKTFYLPSIPAFIYPDFRLGFFSKDLLKTLNEFSPDVVQIVTPANVGLMGIAIAKLRKIPVVGVFHGYFMKPEYLKVVGIKKGTRIIESVGWKFLRFIFQPSDPMISPSQSVKQDLIDHGMTNQLFVCHNGLKIDTSVLDEKTHKKLKEQIGFDPQQTVLYVGRLSKEKNLERLLEIFYLLHEKNNKAKLLIVGGGPIKKELEQIVQLYGIEDEVCFLGEIKHELLFTSGIFKLARVFVTCSTSEVQPMSMIEALFFGMPLVVSDSQGMADLVDEGENGYLVPGDAPEIFVEKIQKILSSQKLYDKFSANALRKSKQFTAAHSAACYLKVFTKVLTDQKEINA